MVSGTLESADPPKILVRDLFELSRAEERLAAELHVRVKSEEASRDRLLALKTVLSEHAGDCAVVLHLIIPGESETLMALPVPPDGRGVEPSETLVREIDALFGRPVAEVSL